MSDERGSEMNAVYTHDEKGKRNDVHAPSVINPGDYEFVKVGCNRKDQIKGGPAGTCHHCGKAIVWEVIWNHLPSGNLVTFGETCTDILSMSNDRIKHEMVLLKRAAENERKKLLWSQVWQDRRDAMTAEFPTLVEFFDNMDLDEERSGFLCSLKWGFDKYGSLLPRQIEAAQQTLQRRQEAIAKRLAEPTPDGPLDDQDGKRQKLQGTIVSHKWQSGGYRYEKTHKMLVRLDDGNKVWGSMPQSIEDHAAHQNIDPKGMKIQFVASVKRSNNDDHFGFFNRPAQAKVI
jgi:hypothetical protein